MLIGNRKIYYGEVKLSSGISVCGICESQNKRLAEQMLRRSVRSKYGNIKYEIKQLWKCPSDMWIEE